MAEPGTKEMPGGKMVEPPKGKKEKPGEMPAGAMQEPAEQKEGKQ